MAIACRHAIKNGQADPAVALEQDLGYQSRRVTLADALYEALQRFLIGESMTQVKAGCR